MQGTTDLHWHPMFSVLGLELVSVDIVEDYKYLRLYIDKKKIGLAKNTEAIDKKG